MIDLTALIREAADGLDMTVESRCEGWLLLVEHGGQRRHIVGHVFPFNTAADGALFDDKCALSTILEVSDVPHVPHQLISAYQRDESGLWKLADQDLDAVRRLVEQRVIEFPVVVKPLRGTNGRRVYRAEDTAECAAALMELFRDDGMAAVSPCVDIEFEYRIVVLRDEVLCVLDKVRGEDWRHNLSHGATATVVEDPAIGVVDLAREAVASIGAELATVDCVRVGGHWLVLEINNGTKLVSFAKQSTRDRGTAVAVYQRVLAAMFNRQAGPTGSSPTDPFESIGGGSTSTATSTVPPDIGGDGQPPVGRSVSRKARSEGQAATGRHKRRRPSAPS